MNTTLHRQLCRVAGAVAIIWLCSGSAPALAQYRTDLTTTTVSQPDMTFARAAALDSQSEIGLATLAQQMTSSDIVKSLAETVQRDHIEASDKLREIAQEKNISIPIVESEGTALVRVKLAQLTGSAFDRAYADALLASQQDIIDRFEQYAKSGSDPELRSYADTMLPKLRKHLAAARDARASL